MIEIGCTIGKSIKICVCKVRSNKFINLHCDRKSEYFIIIVPAINSFQFFIEFLFQIRLVIINDSQTLVNY